MTTTKTWAGPALAAFPLLALCACSQSVPLSAEPDAGCTDECSAGEKRCFGEAAVQVCGDADGDGCQGWGASVACTGAKTCVDGACVAGCVDECAAGTRVCLGTSTVRTCGNHDSDDCLELGGDSACASGTHCEQGACVDDGTPCVDECVLGVAVCEGDAVRTCGQYDADSCSDLSTPAACGGGERCSLGICLPACSDECPSAGDLACEGNGLKTCGLSATTGCLAWGAPQACPAGQTCSGKACSATCSDDCGAAGTTCTADSAGYVACGNFDDDACLDLAAATPCGAGFTCRSGTCVATCADECASGQTRCGADGKSVETCGDYDSDPCREFGGAAPCSGGTACSNGVCESGCADECAEGAVQCVPGQAATQTCGQFDSDACRDWSAPTACLAWQACSAGQCVLGPPPGTLLVNEVLYDSAGSDTAAGTKVFLELWGTPLMSLDGFTVAGVNGNGGADYATLNLDGYAVGADGFFVIAHPQGDASLLALAQMKSNLADFQNGPDSIEVRWHGQVVDALAYGSFGTSDVAKGEGSPAATAGAGQSLSRDVNHRDTGDNLADFAVATPTPRANVATCTGTCAPLESTSCEGAQVKTCADADGDGCGDWSAPADCPAGQQCVGGACAVVNPCSPNPCTGAHKTVCTAASGAAVCSCETGYGADATGACVALDPCSPNPCTAAHRTVCQAGGGVAVCSCDAGWADDGAGTCELVDPCTPNPCTASHQTVCTATGATTAVCSCDPGYVASGTGCVAEQTGSCASSHSDGDAFEPDECPSIAKLATLPASQSRSFSPAGDVDYVSFDASAGHVYEISATTSGSGAPVPGVLVYDTDGTTVLVQSTPSSGTVATVRAKLDAGRHYAKVRAASTSATGSYTLSITDLGADDYGDDAASAAPLTPTAAGASASGSFQFGGDTEVFAVPVTAGRIYRVEETSSADVYFKVSTASTTLVAWRDTPESHTFKASATETVYVSVRPYSGYGASFTVVATDLGLDDHGDDAATATALSAGASASGVFQFPSDVEVFAVPVTAGHIYTFEETSSADVYFKVYTASETLVAWRDTPESYAWECPASGTAYLAVQPYSGFGASFTVKVTDNGGDDYADDESGSATLVPTSAGGTASGTFQYGGDVDVLEVPVTAGRIYRIEETSATDVYLKVYTASATLLAWQDTPESFTFLASASQTVFAAVRPYSGYGTGFTLKATDLGVDDHGGDAATATALAAGGQASGSFQYPGDVEVFAVPVAAGHVYSLAETSSVDVYVEAFTASETLLAWRDESETYVFESAAAQTVYFAVRQYSGFGGAFTVKATDLGVDDYGDDAASGGAAAVGSTVSGSAQYPGDWDFVRVPVTAGTIYRFAETGSADVWVRVVDVAGGDLAYQDTPESLTFKASASGTAAFGVRPYSGAAYDVGWTMELTDLGADDYGDDKASAAALTLGTATSGNLQFPGDDDYFKFTVSASDTFAFQCLTTGVATSVAVYSSGSSTALASGSGANGVTFTVPGAGDYYVRVRASTSGTTGAYTVLVRN